MELARVFALEFVFLNHDEDLLATFDLGLLGKMGEGIKFDSRPAAHENGAVSTAAFAATLPTRAQGRVPVAVG